MATSTFDPNQDFATGCAVRGLTTGIIRSVVGKPYAPDQKTCPAMARNREAMASVAATSPLLAFCAINRNHWKGKHPGDAGDERGVARDILPLSFALEWAVGLSAPPPGVGCPDAGQTCAPRRYFSVSQFQMQQQAIALSCRYVFILLFGASP